MSIILVLNLLMELVVLVPTCWVEAKLKLPTVFSDDMVLQQLDTVRIWGWARAAQAVNVSVTWSESTFVTQADKEGNWEVSIPTCQAGGPHELRFSTSSDTVVLLDVLVGEVWLCSGQSNMVWGAAFGHQEMLEELTVAHHPTIRLFNVTRNQSGVPLDTLQDTWQVCDSVSARQFSAIGYFAAKALHEKLNVPIGVISSCAGSTTVETWTPSHVFEVTPALTLLTNHSVAVGSHWNAMIHPFAGFKIKGVFWYQGEGNVISYPGYGKLLTGMVSAWREAWGYAFPFFQVQIAPYTYASQGVLGNKAAFLREQQLHTLTIVPKTGLVVTTDLVPDVDEIHPPKKREIANRLSNLALAEVYGRPLVDYKSPIYAGYRVHGQQVIIYFDGVKKGIEVEGDQVSHMCIAGADQVFYSAKTTIVGNTIQVFSPRVQKPVAVRFGFTDTAYLNLFNSNGLPVSPFRIDDWDLP